jgi:autotransporter translocation and assembly factor TamB
MIKVTDRPRLSKGFRMSEIPFLVSLPDQDADKETKGIFSSNGKKEVVAVRSIPTDRLKANLSNVCQGLAETLQDIKAVGNFHLKEVTIQVEVTAEGGVELIGTAKLGGKGAITLTFSE